MRWRANTITECEDEGALAKMLRLGPYFTDNVRLFRLASVVSGSSGPQFVQLEDCRTLDVSEYSAEEVMLLGLVPVTASLASDTAGAKDSARPAARRAPAPGCNAPALTTRRPA